MTDVEIYAGTLTASHEDRTATGLLVPYGEECSSNLGRFAVDTGAFTIPADLAGLGLNIEHERENVAGGITALTNTDKGIVATFSFAKTPEGDQALEDARSGRRSRLSAEVKNVVIRAGRAVSGQLFGSALVKHGAFPSATLLAAAVDTEGKSHYETEYTDADGVTWRRVEDSSTTTEETDNGTTTTYVSTVTEEVEEGDKPEETEEEPVGVPNTLTAAKAGGSTITTEERPADPRTVFAAIAAHRTPIGATEEQSTLLAALADVKISGAGSLPVGGAAIQPNWVGQVWQGKEYVRKFIHHLKLGTDISAEGKKGFKLNRGTQAAPKTALGGDWAGNKVEVPTGQGFTSGVGSFLDRFAFAADIAREFYELPGGAPIVEAFMRLIIEDYAQWSDEKALAFVRAQVAALTVPRATVEGFSASMTRVIQSIRLVNTRKDTASFAFVNAAAMDELIYTPHDKVPEFISLAVSMEGTATVDGKVAVVEAPDSFFTGVDNSAPASLAGSKNGIEFDELGSTPVRINALEIAKGGVDEAVHGYLQKFAVRPESYVLVGKAAA